MNRKPENFKDRVEATSLESRLQLTKSICEARDLELVRPLPKTKSTEILLMNEMPASALGA